ncbi:MAG: LTA synthase family protein [Rhizobiaceae bacterium]
MAVARTVSALFLGVALVVIVETVVRGSLTAGALFSVSRAGLTTACLFALIALLIDGLMARRYAGWLLLAPFSIVMAVVASHKANYLGDPLYPSDFLYSRQIVELLPLLVRERPLAGAGLAALMLGFVATLVIALRHLKRTRLPLPPRARLARLAIIVPVAMLGVLLMDYTSFSWTRDRLGILPMMWDQKENYAHNGFTLAFALNAPMAHVVAPDGYSEEAIDAAAPPPGADASLPFERPDIIVVMSESLWDPALLPGVEITPDPLPTIRELRSGSVHSPEFGGMTANAEFEALTGFSNAFLPYGSIPYQQYVRGSVPSLASFLGKEGYRTLAIHPFVSWFWNRANVYESFGFDEFLSEESLPGMEKRGPLASDIALTREIIGQVEASERPSFIFAVSLQGHGPYEPGRYPDSPIKVATETSEWTRGSIQTYAEGVADADRGLALLLEWARNRDRETVIVVFGDHLPPLGPVYVETGFMPDLVAPRTGPADFMSKVRETPLVVWSNSDGAIRDLGAVSPALLPYYLLTAADIDHPFYTGFLGEVQDRFKVIDRHILVDADEEVARDWQRSQAIDPLLRDYRFVQYDMMFGERHSQGRFFPAPAGGGGPPVATGTPFNPFEAPVLAPARRGPGFPPA